ncbi:TPA: restriction endonuclease [Legionella feeleii]
MKKLTKSDKFEILVSQIENLLQENATVIWNEKIPDPDNPGKLRQIDVLVREEEITILIECRLHKKVQDVKWIEELIGRQLSLNATSIIGVSSSGFTKGALRKAEKFGINLRKIDELTEQEIKSWAKIIKVSVFYWEYNSFKIEFFFQKSDLEKIQLPKLIWDLQNQPCLLTIFSAHLRSEDKSGLTIKEKVGKTFNFSCDFKIEDLKLSEVIVQKIRTEPVGTLKEIELKIPSILVYRNPTTNENNAYIQNYNLGHTRAILNENHLSFILDLSRLKLPPYCQFCYVHVESGEIIAFDNFELHEPKKMIMNIDSIHLAIKPI